MAQATRDLQRRIKGIQNTKKITKAMELVAASKMRRSVNAALATRAYAYRAWAILSNLSAVTTETLHPLLAKRACRRGLLVVFSSDRGLTGGLAGQLSRMALEAVSAFDGAPVDVLVVGKKATEALRRAGHSIIASFPTPSHQPIVNDVLPIARIAIDDYLAKRYDRVDMVWADYRSPLVQKPMRRKLLPLDHQELERMITATGGDRSPIAELVVDGSIPTQEYLFEPSASTLLDGMLPRLVEVQLFQALLDATASEHAARMLAMRSASDAAADLIDELTLTYNQARQAGITRDLAEISSSRAVLESA